MLRQQILAAHINDKYHFSSGFSNIMRAAAEISIALSSPGKTAMTLPRHAAMRQASRDINII